MQGIKNIKFLKVHLLACENRVIQNIVTSEGGNDREIEKTA
jgi:hypothetical protein